MTGQELYYAYAQEHDAMFPAGAERSRRWEEMQQAELAGWLAAASAARVDLFRREDTYQLRFAPGYGVSAINSCIKHLNEKGEDFKAGEISDGYHTFNELYAHRIENFITVARVVAHTPKYHENYPVWRSWKHSDEKPCFGGGWFVLGIATEAGKQMTYHLPEARWDDCWFATEFTSAPEWDGHTSDDVLQRMKQL